LERVILLVCRLVRVVSNAGQLLSMRVEGLKRKGRDVDVFC